VVSQVLAADICQGKEGALRWHWGCSSERPQDEEDKGEKEAAGTAKSQDRRMRHWGDEGEELCMKEG